MANKKISDLAAASSAAACVYEIEVPGVGSFKVTSNAAYGVPQLNASGKVPATVLDLTAYAALAGAAFTGPVSFAGAITSAAAVTASGGILNLTAATSVSVPTLATPATGQGAANADWVRAQQYITVATIIASLSGDGSDGAVILDGTNTFAFFSKSGTVYTLLRPLNATTLKITGAGVQLKPNGYDIRASVSIDTSSAIAGAIDYSGGTGGTGASGGSGGSAALINNSGYVGGGTAGSNSGTPTNAAGGAGVNSTALGGGSSGGSSNGGGNGGSGAGGSGGAGGAVTANSPTYIRNPFAFPYSYIVQTSTAIPFRGANGGSGGGTGGGTGAAFGARGGGGGGGSGVIYVATPTWIKGSANIAGVISAKGGNGGLGDTAANVNAGGGGGGAGGGGGVVILIYCTSTGAGVQTIDASGGTGGTGGGGNGTGVAGSGGSGGDSGLIYVYNPLAATTTTVAYVAGGAKGGVGVTGPGAGGAATYTI